MTVAEPNSLQILVIGICMGFIAGSYVAFVAYWLIMPGLPRRRTAPRR